MRPGAPLTRLAWRPRGTPRPLPGLPEVLAAKAAAAANVSAYRRHALGLPPAPLLPAPSATPAASAAAAAAAASAASAPAAQELSLLQYSSAADGTAYRASVPLVHSSGGAAALWPALHGFGAASATPQQGSSSSSIAATAAASRTWASRRISSAFSAG